MVNLNAATTKPPTQTLKTLNPKPSYCTTTVLLLYYCTTTVLLLYYCTTVLVHYYCTITVLLLSYRTTTVLLNSTRPQISSIVEGSVSWREKSSK